MKLKNQFFVDICLENQTFRVEKCLDKLEMMKIVQNSDNIESELMEKLKNLVKTFNNRWNKSHRIRENFIRTNLQWLDQEFTFDFKQFHGEVKDQKAVGRPEKLFSELLPNSKRLKVSNLSNIAKI